MGEAYVPKPHTQGAYVTWAKPQSKGASVPMPQSQETYAQAAQMDSMPSGVQTPPSVTDQTSQPSVQSHAFQPESQGLGGGALVLIILVVVMFLICACSCAACFLLKKKPSRRSFRQRYRHPLNEAERMV